MNSGFRRDVAGAAEAYLSLPPEPSMLSVEGATDGGPGVHDLKAAARAFFSFTRNDG